jgi:hypothetical protein
VWLMSSMCCAPASSSAAALWKWILPSVTVQPRCGRQGGGGGRNSRSMRSQVAGTQGKVYSGAAGTQRDTSTLFLRAGMSHSIRSHCAVCLAPVLRPLPCVTAEDAHSSHSLLTTPNA